jgi:hypothetical protein
MSGHESEFANMKSGYSAIVVVKVTTNRKAAKCAVLSEFLLRRRGVAPSVPGNKSHY